MILILEAARVSLWCSKDVHRVREESSRPVATLAQRSQASELPQSPVTSQREKESSKAISAKMETKKAEGRGCLHRQVDLET